LNYGSTTPHDPTRIVIADCRLYVGSWVYHTVARVDRGELPQHPVCISIDPSHRDYSDHIGGARGRSQNVETSPRPPVVDTPARGRPPTRIVVTARSPASPATIAATLKPPSAFRFLMHVSFSLSANRKCGTIDSAARTV